MDPRVTFGLNRWVGRMHTHKHQIMAILFQGEIASTVKKI